MDETEFFSPIPDNYKGTKYVVVFGTVMSGLGKGIFSSSLAKIFQDSGLKVAPIKLEGYLNADSGTLNPYRHGEVFVLNDGTECDMDLGTYERILDQDLSKSNFVTSGQILQTVLDKERKGDYLGKDVQMIPHVTGEVKMRLRQLAVESKADVVFVEIGGTVGDLENSYYIEAMRELAFEEPENSVCFVALTYIMEPQTLGEQKSKAAQLGIKRLLANGVQPHVIVCRSTNPVSRSVTEKIAIYSNVKFNRIFGMHDVDSIYKIPTMIKESKIDLAVLDCLGIKDRVNPYEYVKRAEEWNKWTNSEKKDIITIGITGKYTSLRDSYASILHALEHAANAYNSKVCIKWIDTSNPKKIDMSCIDGVVVPGGFGSRGLKGKIACIKYARENNIPFLGLCYGMQAAIIEFAQNVLDWRCANTTEVDSDTDMPVIDILPEQKEIEEMGGTMRLGLKTVHLLPGSLACGIFGSKTTTMRFRHRYEVNPEYVEFFKQKGMNFSGYTEDTKIMQIMELPQHIFFIATQGHPEFSSRPMKPHPMFCKFMEAAKSVNRMEW